MPRKPPKAFQKFGEEYPKVRAAYDTLKTRVREAGPLDTRTAELIQLGIAIGAKLEGAVHSHARVALEAGVTPAAVRHAALLATTTLGFSSMMRSLAWVEDVLDGER